MVASIDNWISDGSPPFCQLLEPDAKTKKNIGVWVELRWNEREEQAVATMAERDRPGTAVNQAEMLLLSLATLPKRLDVACMHQICVMQPKGLTMF